MKKFLKTTGIFLCLLTVILLMRPVQALAGGIWAEIKVRYIVLEADGRWHDCMTPADEDYIGVSAQLECPDHTVMENTIQSIHKWGYGENGEKLSVGEHHFYIASETDRSKLMPGKYELINCDYPKGYEYDNAMESEFPLYVILTQKDLDDYDAFAASSQGGEGMEYEILVPVKEIGTVSAAMQKPEQVKLSVGRDNLYIEVKSYGGKYDVEFQYSDKKNGTYHTLKTEGKTSYIYFAESSLKHGKNYYFRARYAKTVNGEKMYGDYSAPVKVKVIKSRVANYKPVLNVIKEKGSPNKLQITGSQESSYGYRLSYSEKKNGKYKEIKKDFYGEIFLTSLDQYGLQPGKSYYFRVRSVDQRDKERYYSDYSKPKKIKVQ